jgi:hypothetical protein
MTSLLVELAVPGPSSTEERDAILDSIMEKVHAANAVGSKQARLFREYIWFAKPSKPFVRTDKNTVKRRDTVIFYEKEIEQFYKSMEEDGNLAANIDVTSVATISKSIHDLLVDALPEAKEIGPDVDLFSAGVDSLLAFSISNSLRSAVGKHNVSEEKKLAVTSRFVYSHPTINALAEALYDLVHNKTSGAETAVDLQRKSMDRFRAKYTAGLGNGHTVILTGSTGSLGSYLLESLHQQQSVKKIYCLNRAKDGKAKQTAASESRGLTTDWPSQRVEFIQIDISKPNFGLAAEIYSTLLEQTTHIIREHLFLCIYEVLHN